MFITGTNENKMKRFLKKKNFQLHAVFFDFDNPVPPLDARCHLHMFCIYVVTFC